MAAGAAARPIDPNDVQPDSIHPDDVIPDGSGPEPSWGPKFKSAFMSGWRGIPEGIHQLAEHPLDSLGTMASNIPSTIGGIVSLDPETLGGLASQAPMAALPGGEVPLSRATSATARAVTRGVKGAAAAPRTSLPALMGGGALGELGAFGLHHNPLSGLAVPAIQYAYPIVKGFIKGVGEGDRMPLPPLTPRNVEPIPHPEPPPFVPIPGVLPSGRVPGKPAFDTTTGIHVTPIGGGEFRGPMPEPGSITIPSRYSEHSNPSAAFALDQKIAEYAKKLGQAPDSRAGLTLERVNAWRNALGSRPLKPSDAGRLDHLWELLK